MFKIILLFLKEKELKLFIFYNHQYLYGQLEWMFYISLFSP